MVPKLSATTVQPAERLRQLEGNDSVAGMGGSPGLLSRATAVELLCRSSACSSRSQNNRFRCSGSISMKV